VAARKIKPLPPGVTVGGQNRDNRVTRIDREVGEARPAGMDTVVAVANNIPSSLNQQIQNSGCCTKRSREKVLPLELSFALMDVAYTGRTVAALYETLVQGRPYQWVAERYGLKADSFKVARSRVLAIVISQRKAQVG
jgi:hypothetical protein